MKRLFLLLVGVLLLCSPTAYGWGRVGHATIAKIAEDHLTPKAKKMIARYLNGESIVAYASYPDDYRDDYTFDLGWEPSNSPRVVVWSHAYQANPDGTLFEGERKGTEYVRNCTVRIDALIKEFKANHKTMSNEERIKTLALIVHIVGDIHCPKHVRYFGEPASSKVKVKFNGKNTTVHKYWDGGCLEFYHRWGYSDVARLLDRLDKRAIAKVQQGDIYSWAAENAKGSLYTLAVKAGDTISREMSNKDIKYAELQVQRAGYRLAAVLNGIFK